MKKILSVLLVMALILMTGVPAFGAEVDSLGLEKAITAAKNVVTVPDSFTDFNYSTSQNTVNGTTYTYWNLTWNDVSSGGSMYVTIDENGNLTNYYYYNNMNEPDRNQQGLSKITKAQALKTAAEFLVKAVPGYGNRMKQIVNQELGVYGTEYQLYFKLYVNDIPVDFINATVSVNRYTGEISNYYFNGVIGDLNLTSYPTPAGIVGFDAAGKAYISEIGMDLKYYSYYDYMKKTLKVFSAYETTVNGKAIDAKTGKVVDLFFDDYGYPMAGGAGGKDEGTSVEPPVPEFTEEEQAAIENTNGLIEKSAAEAIARGIGMNFGELKTISLSNSYIEKEKYFWNMEFELGYASVNAATSELTGFSLNIDYTNKGGSITQERAKVLAEEFMKKVAPDKFSQIKYVDINSLNPIPYLEADYGYHNVNFVRQANGIDFTSNTMNVTIDKTTGKVVSYNSEWYDKVTFPSIEKVITKEAAFAKTDSIGDYGLIYKKTGADQISLVYDFINDGGILLDGLTGERINWDGTPYTSGTVYTDIKGNWAEKMILELQENGYYLPAASGTMGATGDKFNPKSATTQIEFLRYLYAPVQSQYMEDDVFYNMLITSGIVKKAEINATQNISRQDVAKFVTRYLGYEKLAIKTNIFKSVFKDTPQTGYQGYAAICYAFDIIKGDAKGNFNGSKTITHAESAKVIYMTLKI